jgi:hypothetical protein
MPEGEPQGIIRTLADLARQVFGSLPPAFLMLVILNLAFLGIVLLFLDSQVNMRTKLLGKIIDACMAK